MKEQTAALQEAMAKTKRSEAPVITNLDKVKAVLSGSVTETRASRDEGNAEIATMGTGRGPRSGHFIDDQNKAPSMNFASTVIDTGKSGWIEDNDWFGLNGEEQSEIGPEQLKDLLRKALEGYSGSVAGWVHRALGNNETIEGAKWMGSKTLDLLGVLFAGAKAAAASGPIVKKMLDEAGIPTSKKKLFKKGKKVLKKGVKKKIKKMLKNKNRFIARKYKISQGQSGATGTVVVVYDRKTGKFVAKAKKKNKLTGTSLDRGANAETMQKGKQEQTYKGEYGK